MMIDQVNKTNKTGIMSLVLAALAGGVSCLLTVLLIARSEAYLSRETRPEVIGEEVVVAHDAPLESVVAVHDKENADRYWIPNESPLNAMKHTSSPLNSGRQHRETSKSLSAVAVEKKRDISAENSTVESDETKKTLLVEESLSNDRIKLNDLLKNLGPDHPQVREIKDRIDFTQKLLAEREPDPRRSVLVKIPGRDPQDIARLLAKLFGDQLKIATDDTTGYVAIRATPTPFDLVDTQAVNSLLNQVEKTVAQLQHSTEVPAKTISIPAAKTSTFDSDQEDLKLDRDTRQLAAQIRDAGPDTKIELRRKLEALIEKQFEHRQQRRKSEFEALKRRVEQLEHVQARRQTNKLDVIQRRVNELLDSNTDLNWESSGTQEIANTGKSAGTQQSRETTYAPPTTLKAEVAAERNPRNDSNRKESSVPTYNGISLPDWLGLLQSERNAEKVAEAVMAMNHLLEEAEPRQLIRTTLHMLRTQAGEPYNNNVRVKIMNGSVLLLTRLPCEIVAEELTAELTNSTSLKSTREFLTYFLNAVVDEYSVDPNGRTILSKSMLLNGPYHPNNYPTQFTHYVNSLDPSWIDRDQLADAVQRLRAEIQRRSRRLIGVLVSAANNDEKLIPWMMYSTSQIKGDYYITSYAGLVEIVDRAFSASEGGDGGGQKTSNILAAKLLGESGLRVPEVVQFAMKLISIDGAFPSGVSCLEAVAPHSPDVVHHMNGSLQVRWWALLELVNKLATDDQQKADLQPKFGPANQQGPSLTPDQKEKSKLVGQCVLLMKGLARIGFLAKDSDSIPLLQEIASSANSMVLNPNPNPGMGQDYWGSLTGPQLRDIANNTIKQIEEAKPKPTPAPLPEDDAVEAVPLRTRKPEDSAEVIPSKAVKRTYDRTLSDPAKRDDDELPAKVVERTYDGIVYSHWLTLLETEREPSKLATAIEACSRLALKGDERRIVQGICQATSPYEQEKWSDEKNLIWKAGTAAFKRLPSQAIVDELLVRLREPLADLPRGSFLMEFLFSYKGIPHTEILRIKADDILTQLVKSIPPEPTKETAYLAAIASVVWQNSGRPLSDFNGLSPRLLSVISQGFPNVDSVEYEYWNKIASNLVKHEPAAPNHLAAMLVEHAAKHSPNSFHFISLIGELGDRAEPAVPVLVEMFLDLAKRLEEQTFQIVAARRSPEESEDLKTFRNQFFKENMARVAIIETLGEIRGGEMGLSLLRQLKRIAPFEDEKRGNDYFRQLFKAINDAYPKIAGIELDKPQRDLLSDFWKMNGQWKLQTSFPVSPHPKDKQFQVMIYGSDFQIGHMMTDGTFDSGILDNENGDEIVRHDLWKIIDYPELLYTVTFDKTKSPQQLTLNATWSDKPKTAASRRIDGIYELTENMLNIQLAKPGTPRPREFTTEASQLPANQVQLMFDRVLPTDSGKVDQADPTTE